MSQVHWRFVVWFTSVLAVGACGQEDHGDLRQELAGLTKDMRGRVDPLPMVKPYEPVPYTADGLVDPFRPQRIEVAQARVGAASASRIAEHTERLKEPLEAFPLESIQMLGTITQDREVFALVKAGGNLHRVRKGNYLGQNFGVITGIDESQIILKELAQDSGGEWIEREIALFMGGASSQSVPSAQSRANSPAVVRPGVRQDVIPVLFATNRGRTNSDNPYTFYGNQLIDAPDRQNVRRGIAYIKIPPNRLRGEVQRPGWIRITLERVSSHPLARAAGIDPVKAADSQTEFSYARKIEELTAADFAAELKRAVEGSRSKTAVLYVHGYANDFSDAAFRAAQIVFDLETATYDLVPLMFSWPSDPGAIRADYDEARRRTQASGYDLANFLKDVAANTDIGAIHIIAHSMGSEVLGHAMVKLGVSEMGFADDDKVVRPVFRQIVFAAPDVTPRIFEDVIEPAIRTGHVITTYGAPRDLALWLSTLKNRQARVGSVSASGRLPECVDTIDVSEVADEGLAHSTWAESPRVLDDLRLVLRDGLEPSQRGLTRRRLMERTIWKLPAKGSAIPNAAKVGTSGAFICHRR